MLEDVIGYLNFSSGRSDPKFLAHLSELFQAIGWKPSIEGESAIQGELEVRQETATVKATNAEVVEGTGFWKAGARTVADRSPPCMPRTVATLCQWLRETIDQLEGVGGPFADVNQARQVVGLLEQQLLPAYREFHRDLLYHQCEAFLWSPFFIGRAFEALLAQGAPWDESQRIVDGAIARLNDFVGYRPVAILESGQGAQPYAHEFVQPIPLSHSRGGCGDGALPAAA